MKKIIFLSVIFVILLTVSSALPYLGGSFSAESIKITKRGETVTNYKATIEKGAFFPGLMGFEELKQRYVILKSHNDLEDFTTKIMNEFRKDTAEVPDNYWATVEKQILESYARFDNDFFAQHTLVIALIDQGSGNVSYQVENVKIDHGKLKITIEKDAPMIQTMDFVSWVLLLELDNEYDYSSVKIKLV